MGYCTIQDLRDEGISTSFLTDERATLLIRKATLLIDKITDRWFEPRNLVLKIQGRGTDTLHLNHPIIQIDEINIVSGRGNSMTRDEISVDDVLIYNRHLTQGLLNPDDRDNPKIVYQGTLGVEYPGIASGIFVRAEQIVELDGTFGYTELAEGVDPGETSDGSQVPTSQGITPELITHACMLIVIREAGRLGDIATRQDFRNRYRLQQEKTADQSYTMTPLSSLQQIGTMTGDPEIDGILALYMAPPDMGVI